MTEVKAEKKNNVLWITLDRPKRYNAITAQMFNKMRDHLEEAAEDDSIAYVVITGGNVKYYSAGSDFSPAELMKLQDSGNQEHGYKRFVDTLIQFPKPVVAVVNGPAVGIAVTTLGLMDMVISIDTATFHCPFADLGLCPEAAASKTFVDLIGYQRAAAIMLFSEKLTAQEALQAGLVTKVIPADKFNSEVAKLLEKYSKLSPATMQVGKRLMRTEQKIDELLTVNRREERMLNSMFSRDDTIDRLTSKFSPSSKL